jgi:hypothetical protein
MKTLKPDYSWEYMENEWMDWWGRHEKYLERPTIAA